MAAKKEIHLSLYCDESVHIKLGTQGKRSAYWDYIGMLLVPTSRSEELLTLLLNARCLNPENEIWCNCQKPCGFHDQNNTEVHYKKLDKSAKYQVACSWIEMLLRQTQKEDHPIYFYILGIDRSKLDLERFGPVEQQNRDMTIYNRFFRTAVKKSTQFFFSGFSQIVIDNVYHDRTSGENHPYFPWHIMKQVNQECPRIHSEMDRIQFINSDHRAVDGHNVHSHFVQFIDLILGCTVNILHGATKRDSNKEQVSLQAKDLLGDRIIKKPKNKNSHYHYYRKQAIEFFPKYDLSKFEEDSLLYKLRRYENFYTERSLLIEEKYKPPRLPLFED